ncbi:MAG TPA: amino acid ABC transporter substrate-binding protein [Burkholderiales bacterium]|jgi:ABC-type amino acid transport substrate-binding protein|nr:amino acid ABC transporter substrate-binding protein [Burkholderiales bacterium]
MFRTAIALTALLFAALAAQAQNLDGRLKQIASTKTIAIAYRTDAIPFSYTDDKKQVDGFSIDLCKRIVRSIERDIKVSGLQIKWVPVTSQTRFDAVAKGQADMECGSSTATLSRMQQVDFSSYIFVETTGLMVKQASGLRSLSDMSGKKIAVIGGTTNERALNDQLKRLKISATVLPVKTRDEAFALLEGGKADAMASDKLLLLGAAVKAKDPQSMAILNDELSFEPYGIVLPRGDAAFRLAVNSALSTIYRNGEIVEIFNRWFAGLGRPTPIIEAAYSLGIIPE